MLAAVVFKVIVSCWISTGQRTTSVSPLPSRTHPDYTKRLIETSENLMTACLRDELEEAKILLSVIPTQYRHSTLRSILFRAIEDDNSKAVKLLFELKGKEDIRPYGFTPLGLAALKGSINSLSFLSKSVNNFEQDREKRTAMHYAAIKGPLIIRKLASTPKWVNVQDVYGKTPLHYAVGSRLDSVMELVKLGADPKIKDVYGRLAIDCRRPEFQLEKVKSILQGQ